MYSISYKNTLFSCSIIDNKFCDFQTVVVRPDEKYHGVLAFGNDSVYVTNMLRPNITEYNVNTKSTHTIVCSGGTRMKDVAILDSNHILAISSDNGPVNGIMNPDGSVFPKSAPYNSHALIYNKHTGERKAIYTFEKTQIDSCLYRSPYCYITCADCDGQGYIWKCRLDADFKFGESIKISCAGFPHGMDIYGDMFAYTSYTESALYIMRKIEDIYLDK